MSSSRALLLILVLSFLITRIYFALWYNSPASDTGIYYNYSSVFFKKDSGNFSYTYQDKIIEYPPLAVLWMSFPGFVSQKNLLSFEAWNRIFKMRYLIFDCFIFFILCFLVYRANSFLKIDAGGIMVYVLGGIFLFNFLYERIDFWLAGLMFFSAYLLFTHLHWCFSLVVLALAINFKIIPLIISPLIVLATMPLSSNTFVIRKMIYPFIKRVVVLILLSLLIFAPFYLLYGTPLLDFIGFHSSRGLQLESLYSSLIMLFNQLGYPAYVTHGYGAFNIESSLSVFFAKISSYLIFAGIAFVFCFFILKLMKKYRCEAESLHTTKYANIAQFAPQQFISTLIITLLLGMGFSKVLSPQYLLWVLPLFAVLSYENKYIKIAAALFVLACAFTTPIYPYVYYEWFVRESVLLPDGKLVYEAPALKATIVLLIRNLLLLLSAGVLLYSMLKREVNLPGKEV